MTLNRRRLLRFSEYAAVSASVAGAIAAVATQQLVYAVTPLSIAVALNLASRRHWEQHIEQRLVQDITRIDQRLDRLSQQNRLFGQRIKAVPAQSEADSTTDADSQVLREEMTQMVQRVSEDLQALRQLTQQENLARRSDLDGISTNLRQLYLSLASLESLNLENRLQALERMQPESQAGVDDAIAQLRADVSHLNEELTRLHSLIVSIRDGAETAEQTSRMQWLPPRLPSNQDFTLEINLGIDFGTGFTKVCFRDLASDRAEIVTFSEAAETDLERALLSTKVAILEDGTLLTGLTAAEWASNNHPVRKNLEFIKMRLAHIDLPQESEWRLEQIPELDDPETVENICAYYLSSVITRSQAWIQHRRADLFKNQVVRWSLNVGVPVQYCDSPALKRFQKVLSLAWLLANSPSSNTPLTIPSLNQLGTHLRQWMQQNLESELDCFTTPEIAAAVWSFLSSRQAVEKFYTFFDFGDGTLDGTAFRFWRECDGDLKVDFYTGQVRPLGVTAFTQQAAAELQTSPDTVRQALLEWQLATDNELHINMCSCHTRKQIQKLIASTIMLGKNKHHDNRGLVAKNELGDQLDIFVGGGGSRNLFLKSTVSATHKDFQQNNAGVPPYRLRNIPAPDDLLMNGLQSDEFHRFSVAYGLCIPSWEGPEIRLPSEVEANTKPPSRESNRVPRYEDTKDFM